MKIFDGHNDILNKITGSPDPLNAKAFLESGPGQMDFPRALQAGFVGGFFAVYTSNPPTVPSSEARTVLSDEGYQVIIPPPLPYNYAHQSVLKMIDLMEKIEEESQGRLKIVTNYQELEACLENHVMAAVLHLEGAEPILPNLENLDFFYQKGMRSLGITWSRPNAFGSGVPFAYPSSPDTGPGLTDAGKKLVAKCDEMGVMLDLAHLNEKGFWDAAELSSAPLVSTHSAAWGIIPKARNLTDDQLKAIRDSNGVAGIIFSVNDIDGGKRPKHDAPITTIIDHIRYLADL
ncbi:MAG: membrane dipeptidase, partial [Anaerolineales bacterium]|nr:membrane dipeptidase [Anaerolineales bacterium]